ncbi:hypothetical protein [Mesorhizobium sp. M8A.F.Ca.ET.021.01.1.1]|uniref:hypothetical protein n=1 Tax=Mesorhizobium sp. M8A.F.Ca.ET.021.01.1.1 TaxID=2496757 RepID=UPI000FCC5E44|nr:hypothetical protein [Mesorhizobium sp. M8A.F.Ca.ET.021.01.1.1]RUW43887.1 hypothetical protein EOA36_33110 [Mesorhizobium sp. M8A.F.Ca.ET.021.01.1.1]
MKAAVAIVPDTAYDIRKVGKAVLGYRLAPAPRKWTMDRHRLDEIETTIKDRHGSFVDTDDGEAYLRAAFPHLPDDQQRRAWARKWCPLISEGDIAYLLAAPLRRLKAREIGDLLAVTIEQRSRLDLRSIRASGQTDADIAAVKRERDATAVRSKRAAQQPSKPRKPKLKDERPWEALGISRRTWFRHQQTGGTKLVAHKSILSMSDKKSATAGSAAPRPRATEKPDPEALRALSANLTEFIHNYSVSLVPIADAARNISQTISTSACHIRSIKIVRAA